jgi:hypothetical protein
LVFAQLLDITIITFIYLIQRQNQTLETCLEGEYLVSNNQQTLVYLLLVGGTVGLFAGLAGLSDNKGFIAVIGLLSILCGIILFFKFFTSERSNHAIPKVSAHKVAFEYLISLPRATSWESGRAHQFTEQILTAFPELIFRIVATHDQMEWRILDLLGYDTELIQNAVRINYPNAHITVQEFHDSPPTTQPFYRVVLPYMSNSTVFFSPFLYVDEIRQIDPLATLTQAMSQLKPGERIIYTVAILGFAKEAYKEGQNRITQNVYKFDSVWDVIFPEKRDAFVPHLQHFLEKKLQNRLFKCLVFVQFDTPNAERFSHLKIVDSQMVHFDREEFNSLRPYADDGKPEYVDTDAHDRATNTIQRIIEFLDPKNDTRKLRTLRYKTRLVLGPKEIAALWHLPHQGFQASTIHWSPPLQVAIPQVLKGRTQGIFLGTNTNAGHKEPVYVATEDRATHYVLVGKPGTGKSNLLHNLIHQDIEAGRGVAVIDPHGQLVDSIIRVSIPTHREQDVVILDLAEYDHPIPLNPFRGTSDHTAIIRLSTILNRLYPDLAQLVQTSDALENALLTLQADPDATLLDIDRLFLDADFRQTLLARIDDQVILNFWQYEYGLPKKGEVTANQLDISRPVMRRIHPFVRNKYMRCMLCHPNAIQLGEYIKQRKIILIRLKDEQERFSESEQALIGSLLIEQIQLAVLQNAAREHPFACYIDEVHKFISPTLETMFRETRKFGLQLIVATQSISDKYAKTDLEPLVDKTGTLIAFQPSGETDARILARYMKPSFDVDALLNLDKFQAAVRTWHGEGQLPAFSVSTPRPLRRIDRTHAPDQRVRQLSAEQYPTRTCEEVLGWLSARHNPPNPQGEDDGDYDPNPPS